ANTYSGGTNLAGTGTLNVTRGDLLGIGNVHFLNNGAQDTSKLNVTGTATLNQQLIAETGSNGLVTVDKTKNLTIHRIVDTTDSIDNAVDSAVYVKTGGQLKIQAQPQGRYGNIIFSENGTKNDGSLLEKGSAAFVEYGGQLEMDGVTVSKNKVQTGGGIIYNEGNTIIRSGIFSENIGSAVRASGNSKTEIFDSTFTKNSTDGNGAAVYYQGSNGNNSSLTISATAGKMTLFSDNHAETKTETGTVANSIHLTAVNNGTANLIIDTHKDTKSGAEGIVDMLDPISSDNGNYTINVTKTGEGTWKLAGNNELKSTNGTFQITNGIVDLYKEGKIEITNGTFSIDAAGTLNSRGENSVTAKMISFADGATLGFDLTESKSVTEPEGSPALLNLNTNSLNFNRTKIDLLELSSQSESGYGIFNLLTTDTLISDSTVVSLELQYHGQDMKQFRQQFGVLKTTNDGKTLQVEITKTDNGTTQWTNKSENLQWDATSHNWHGISQNISTTTQFLDGDTIIFTDNGAGKITIIDGGVNIAGMTVDNSAGEKNDYVFQGGSISPVTGKKDSGLLKKGSGTVTFTQENYFEGGTIIEGGKVVANKISSLGTGDIVFKNNNDDAALEFNLDGQSSGVLEQKIIGETGNRGQLIKSGSGSLTLKNQNTYGGETIIRGGTLIAEGLDTLGSGNIITGDETGHGTMVLNLAKDEVFTKEISGTGSLKTAGTGTLTLTQENNYSGGTTIESGTAIFAQNINSLGTGDIRNDGKLTLDLASDGILKQSMSGIGSFEKRGNGLLELTQANTFSGKTILTAGTLRLKNESALQNSVLDYQNGNLDIGNLNRLKLGGIAGTQNLLLNNSSGQAVALTVGADNQDTVPVYNGNITGTGNVTKIGGGIQKFAGQNTYSGGTTISDGRLVSIGISGFGTGNIVNNAEMEFEINANNEETYEKTISGTGSLWKSGSGTLTLVGKNTYEGETIIENGRIAVSSIESLGRISEKGYEESAVVMRNENASLLLDFNENVTFSRTINGTGSVYKTGNGILTLEKDLNLNGSTHVLAGTLFVNAEAKTATTVYDGATLGGDGFINNSVTFRNGSSQIIGQNENAKLTTFTAKNINYENGSTVYIKVGQNGSDQVIAKD
ncbi:MAG: autotransporter-associated beta strand repeat-containing protein, partial [Planctomycetaceae bacterium]|nr:autotransporter-associated beta strand repeat-containing protein [Planctomycetaceae bacterium]